MQYGKRHVSALVLSLGMLFAASAAQAQVVGYNFRSGDLWVDTRLGEINDYGSRYREPFIGEMTGYYGAPRSLIVDLFDRRWSAGDIYYACSIAHVLGVPCVNVVREYDRNPGQGWGAIAKRMGIKPGSAEFHRLKQGFVPTYDRWARPIRLDAQLERAFPNHGKGKGGGKPAHAGGKSGHGDGHAQGKGKSGAHGNGGQHGGGAGKAKGGKAKGKG